MYRGYVADAEEVHLSRRHPWLCACLHFVFAAYLRLRICGLCLLVLQHLR